MPKHKEPLVAALVSGNSYVFKVSDGGDLASMRAVLKHGQKITFSPITNIDDIQIGDIVIVRWRGSNFMMHMVQEIEGKNFLIVNSLGKVNGWVSSEDVIGRASQIIDPPPRPAVPEMLHQLREHYANLIQKLDLEEKDAERLLSNEGDLRWYAEHIGETRWTELVRQNFWSYESHVWHLLKEVAADLASDQLKPIEYYINHGKEHIGEMATALQLLEGY